MYHFSRAMYRELSGLITDDGSRRSHQEVLVACEAAVERMAEDRLYFARPSRSLFNDIRFHFPMSQQCRVYRVVDHYMNLAREASEALPRQGLDINGNVLQCRATTRKGTPCQRVPLAHNGYCPSHQHLAETEDVELVAA